MKPSGSSPSYEWPGSWTLQFGVTRRKLAHSPFAALGLRENDVLVCVGEDSAAVEHGVYGADLVVVLARPADVADERIPEVGMRHSGQGLAGRRTDDGHHARPRIPDLAREVGTASVVKHATFGEVEVVRARTAPRVEVGARQEADLELGRGRELPEEEGQRVARLSGQPPARDHDHVDVAAGRVVAAERERAVHVHSVQVRAEDRKSTRLNSSHVAKSY